ncbi:MAG: YihY/virulence factor BrkB family protein [Bacteroidetes bacterium]|nr:YihY/virulence factor BrkB family protein [Bacteroidota bacterium]
MKRHMVSIYSVCKESIQDFSHHKALQMSAALAYYTVFAIAPVLILVISLCDIFYGRAAIEGKLFENIQGLVGADAARQIEQIIRNITVSRDVSWASIVGVCALILAATGVFTEIQDSINFIWRLKAKPKKGWLKLILNRVLSFSMIVVLGFVLLVSLVVNSVIDLLGEQLLRAFPDTALFLVHTANLVVTFLTVSILFATIFKVLPDARIKWQDVVVGSFATAFLFMIGRYAIGFYLAKTHISSTYGAAGAVVIILLWVYYSAIILYLGASFTRVYAIRKGRNIYPTDYAVWIQEIELENKASLQVQDHPVLTNTSVSVEEPRAK